MKYLGDMKIDTRRRGKIPDGSGDHDLYRVEMGDGGVLTLTPLVTVPVTMVKEGQQLAPPAAEAQA